MKLKVIKDFNTFIYYLGIGYRNDYSKILHDICFVQNYQYLEKIDPIYEYLINN